MTRPPASTPEPSHHPRHGGGQEADGIDFKEYFLILYQKLWLIALFTIAGVGGGLYFASKITPVFASRSVLMFEAQEDRVLNNIQAVRSEAINDKASMDTLIETLNSRTMLERVAQHGKFDHDFNFLPKPENAEAHSLDAMISALRGSVRISRRAETRLIDITAQHRDAECARKIAQTFAEEFIRLRLDLREQSNRLASQFLLEEANRLKEKISAAETKLHEYRETKGLISLEKDQDVVIGRFKEINAQHNLARDRRLQLEADSVAAAAANKNPEKLLQLPSITQQPAVAALMASLVEKEAEFNALKERYKPKHPRYLAASAAIDGLKARIEETTLAAASMLDSSLLAARENESRLAASLESQEKGTFVLGKAQVEYDAMKRDIETDKTVFNTVLGRLKETDLTKGLEQSSVKLIEPAVASYAPVASNKTKLTGQWIGGGLVLGVVLVLLLHFLDGTIKTVSDAERTTGLRVLAAVTEIPAARREGLVTVKNRHSPAAEAFRSLRSAIQLSRGAADPARVILVTSAVPAEGKSFTASNFAVACAQQGLKTLLVDADLRRPTLAGVFEVPKDGPGLSEILGRKCGIADAIVETSVAGLHLMSAGKRPDNPAELLSPGGVLQVLFEQLASRYDRIIIDTPPILAVSDTLLLSAVADYICLVIRAGKTTKQCIHRASIELEKAGKSPDGMLMNRLNPATASYYYYYQKRGYGQPAKVYGSV